MFSDCTSSFAYICLSSPRTLWRYSVLWLLFLFMKRVSKGRSVLKSSGIEDFFWSPGKQSHWHCLSASLVWARRQKYYLLPGYHHLYFHFLQRGGMRRYVCLCLLASTAVQMVCAVGCLSFPIIIFQYWSEIGKDTDYPISHTASHAQWDIVRKSVSFLLQPSIEFELLGYPTLRCVCSSITLSTSPIGAGRKSAAERRYSVQEMRLQAGKSKRKTGFVVMLWAYQSTRRVGHIWESTMFQTLFLQHVTA